MSRWYNELSMSETERIRKKLHTSLKLSGFLIRNEFCLKIINKFTESGYKLGDNDDFETCIKKLCEAFEQICQPGVSIEKDHIEKVLNFCLENDLEKTQKVFQVINAFDFPKIEYNAERKVYQYSRNKSKIFGDPDSKRDLFMERYRSVLHRVQRNFSSMPIDENERPILHTIDYLLTLGHKKLTRSFILGCLMQGSESVWYLEDPSGFIKLDFSDVQYDTGFYVENSFVLANGYYEDKILKIKDLVLPPGETYENSRPTFNNLNYFSQTSEEILRSSKKLQDALRRKNGSIYFFSDFHLDHPLIFEKLELMFGAVEEDPPVAFVFMGNFLSESHAADMIEVQQRLFRRFGEVAGRFRSVVATSNFVFVPGPADPCILYTVPRHSLPSSISTELLRYIPKAIFATNPCRLQYYSREITIFRADLLIKFLQGSLHKPNKNDLAAAVTQTIISQGHLTPFSLNALPVHWDFDYTLRVHPLPDLIVIGDNAAGYHGEYKNCQVFNPGPFCESGFQFKTYTPNRNEVEDCEM